jgi:hypothetical protein
MPGFRVRGRPAHGRKVQHQPIRRGLGGEAVVLGCLLLDLPWQQAGATDLL